MNIFRNRAFVQLFLASLASQLGTTIGNMAFAFYLLDRFSSQPYFATLAELMYAVPTLFVFFLVGVCADRLDRQKIAEHSDWIRLGLTLLLLAAIYFQMLVAVFVILFLRSAIAKFFQPAEVALLQGILNKEQYAQASGLNQMLFGVFMLFGVALGAMAYNLLGMEGAVIIDGISFLISALLIRTCSIREEVRLPNGRMKWRDIGVRLAFSDFREGLRYILQNRLLIAILSGFFIFGFINGGFTVLPIFSMKYNLASGDFEKFASLFAIFLGIGFLVGSVLGSLLMKAIKPYWIMIAGIGVTSLLTFAMGYTSHVWLYLVLVFVTGLVIAPVNIAIGGWMPAIVDPGKMGRVSAWIDPLMMLAQSIALGLIALLYPLFIHLEMLYYGMGIGLFFIFLFYMMTLPRLTKQGEVLIPKTV